MSNQQTFIPSASVVLLRENQGNLEVLLLKKNSKITYGGSWVFPGGRTDDHDHELAESEETLEYAAERKTVIRECREETSLNIEADALMPIALWNTPASRPKRFTTTFFIYNATQLTEEIQIDQGEIVDAKWRSAAQAIDDANQGKIVLAGPGFVTLSILSKFQSIDAAWAYFSQCGFAVYAPRIQVIDGGAMCLYDGDECYELLTQDRVYTESDHIIEIEAAQQQHRLYMYKEKPWIYVS